MKLKQALVLGLTTIVLAIPAFAAEEMNAVHPSSANADQKKSVPATKLTPAKKDAHKRGEYRHGENKDGTDIKKLGTQADMDKPGLDNINETN